MARMVDGRHGSAALMIEDCRHVLERVLLEERPSGAELLISQQSGTAVPCVRMELRPAAAGATPVTVSACAGADLIDVELGRDFDLELTINERSTSLATHLEELEAITRAVIRGNVTETTWVRDEIVLRSEVEIVLPSGEVLQGRVQHGRRGSRKGGAARTVTYKPY